MEMMHFSGKSLMTSSMTLNRACTYPMSTGNFVLTDFVKTKVKGISKKKCGNSFCLCIQYLDGKEWLASYGQWNIDLFSANSSSNGAINEHRHEFHEVVSVEFPGRPSHVFQSFVNGRQMGDIGISYKPTHPRQVHRNHHQGLPWVIYTRLPFRYVEFGHYFLILFTILNVQFHSPKCLMKER